MSGAYQTRIATALTVFLLLTAVGGARADQQSDNGVVHTTFMGNIRTGLVALSANDADGDVGCEINHYYTYTGAFTYSLTAYNGMMSISGIYFASTRPDEDDEDMEWLPHMTGTSSYSSGNYSMQNGFLVPSGITNKTVGINVSGEQDTSVVVSDPHYVAGNI